MYAPPKGVGVRRTRLELDTFVNEDPIKIMATCELTPKYHKFSSVEGITRVC